MSPGEQRKRLFKLRFLAVGGGGGLFANFILSLPLPGPFLGWAVTWTPEVMGYGLRLRGEQTQVGKLADNLGALENGAVAFPRSVLMK